MVPATLLFRGDVIAYSVNKIDLQKGFAAYKRPNNGLRVKIQISLMVKHIINETPGRSKRHAFLLVLAHKIAILACQLAILGDNECDRLCFSALPFPANRFYSVFRHKYDTTIPPLLVITKKQKHLHEKQDL
jgi:hypothetical protein